MYLWQRTPEDRYRCAIHEGTPFERFYEVDAVLFDRAQQDRAFRKEMIAEMWSALLGDRRHDSP